MKKINHAFKPIDNSFIGSLNCYICGEHQSKHRLYPKNVTCSFCGELNPTDKHLQIHFLEDKVKQIIEDNTITLNSFLDKDGKNTLNKVITEISEYVFNKIINS